MPFINLTINNTDISLVEAPSDKMSVVECNICNSSDGSVTISAYLSLPRFNILSGITLGSKETLVIEKQMVAPSQKFFIGVSGGSIDVTGFYGLYPPQ